MRKRGGKMKVKAWVIQNNLNKSFLQMCFKKPDENNDDILWGCIKYDKRYCDLIPCTVIIPDKKARKRK